MTQAESGKMLNENKHHPLTGIKKDLEKNRDTQDAFLEIDSNLSFFIIRGEAEDKLFFDEVFNLLGQSLPLEPNTFTSDKHQLYWLGPNEWLLVADAEKKILVRNPSSKNGMHIINQSGALIQMKLSGNRASNAISKGCTLNLEKSLPRPGYCAQTLMAKSNIVLSLTDDKPTYNIIVRRSFSEHLAKWLQNAIEEFNSTDI